jgi:hypothetical protein
MDGEDRGIEDEEADNGLACVLELNGLIEGE